MRRRPSASRAETRGRRWRWQVLLHRPRLWRFWRVRFARTYRPTAYGIEQHRNVLELGEQHAWRSPLLIIALFHRRFRAVGVGVAWHPTALQEPRFAPKPLLVVRLQLRRTQFHVGLRIMIWPGREYALHGSYEIRKRLIRLRWCSPGGRPPLRMLPPRLWRFWRIKVERSHLVVNGIAMRRYWLSVGAGYANEGPLLVVSLYRGARTAVFACEWSPTQRNGGSKAKLLFHVSPDLHVGRLVVWLTLAAWPGFVYQFRVGYEIARVHRRSR